MTDVVLFNEVATASGKKIAIATLNKPKALNALGLDMIQLLMPQLLAWQQDEDIAAVVLDSEGDKAFCAGGDVVAMHNAMLEQPKTVPQGLVNFFTWEYKLDYLIHTFGKPFVVWGNGIVMGGGLGLMCGASHRIVTESSRIAMPEITIGLYPDVGGSWFLNKMPGGCGMFMGLTGASINAMDAMYLNMADHFIPHQHKLAFLQQMQEINWGQTESLNHEKLTALCSQLQTQYQEQIPVGNVKIHQALIDEVTAKNSVAEVVEAILTLDVGEDKWLSRAQKTLAAGSPITMHLVEQQLARGQYLSLADCFRMELNMSCRCGEFGEFQEGVRALLIDKDNQPKWLFDSVQGVPEAFVQQFFEPIWSEGSHPLAELGQ